MAAAEPQRIKTISKFHQLVGLSRPEHPLISVIDLEDVKRPWGKIPASRTLDFYTIKLKRYPGDIFKYGQQQYDAQGGVMYFIALGQVFGLQGTGEEEIKITDISGWEPYIHPGFLWNTSLAGRIKKYEYFDYSVNEALYLSEKEEDTIITLMQKVQTEYFADTDKFSQDIIISMIGVLLNYADRFYHRQFLNQKIESHQMLDRLEDLLTSYFNSTDLLTLGLPSVQFIAKN